MDSFWQAFWPSLASTVLGVILGVPIALWLHRRVALQAERLKVNEEQRRLGLALENVRHALRENRQRLDTLVQTIQNGLVLFDCGLDNSAWDAVKFEVTEHLHDPVLQVRLAYHFSQLGSLARLNDMYLNYAAGLASAVGRSEHTRHALRNHMLQMATRLATDADEIIALIDTATKSSAN